MATVSHMPHVIANVLVQEAAATLAEEHERLPEVGTSFRDTTRVAGANPTIWEDIYAANADAVADAIDAVSGRLADAARMIRGREGAAVGDWHRAAREDRRRLLEAEIEGGELFELRVAVENRPGTVAEIALALGRERVNIEDMALSPAVDMRTGVHHPLGRRRGRGRARRRHRALPGARRLGRRRRGVVAVATARFDPAGPLRGSLRPPPDKSISHRAAILAAMGEGETAVRGYLDAADTNSTLAAIAALGAKVESTSDREVNSATGEQALRIQGVGLRGAAPAAIDVGNAGTLMRLLPGWLAGQPEGRWTLDGDESIRQRPVDRVVEPPH